MRRLFVIASALAVGISGAADLVTKSGVVYRDSFTDEVDRRAIFMPPVSGTGSARSARERCARERRELRERRESQERRTPERRAAVRDVETKRKYTEEHILFLQARAEAGNPEAQSELGYCYANALGVSRNYSEAVKWYTLAAKQGNVDAITNLGICYANGMGCAKNPAMAAQLYLLAATAGRSSAAYYMYLCYAKGFGVDKDLSKAAFWLYRAMQGMYGSKLTDAIKWLHSAAEQGVAGAQCYLGLCYMHGFPGVESGNSAEAEKWLLRAAEQGYGEAQCRLGMRFLNRDNDKAIFWIHKAAYENGHPEAQYRLGLLYLYPEEYSGIAKKDPSKAVAWLRKAAEQGHA